MAQINNFSEGSIEAVAKVLSACGSGSDISRVLSAKGIPDNSGESTKWRRLYGIFLEIQQQDRCANRIVDFIQSFLIPSRFVGRHQEFEDLRQQLNTILAFDGLEYGEDGQFRFRTTAKTLTEADKRLRTIQAKFHGRILHSEVLKYCKTELMQDNYFHAVFEASKGLAERIRQMSGATADGAKLIDQVFAIERPILAINSLRTETEQSEHKGFASLLKGCFAAIRNPLAHGPKIMWEGEDDAADYLSLISLLHRKLDKCVTTHHKIQG